MQRILVVDDEPSIRALYQLELEDLGFEVKTAADTTSALWIVHSWSPDLVVLDIKLGGDNGLDLLRRIAERRHDIRTVIVSGYAGYRDDFTTWLADAYLTKSQDVSELLRTVRELLAAPVA